MANNSIVVSIHSGKEEDRDNRFSDYVNKSFTPSSIRGDLATMDRVLHDAKQDDAALVCHNASRMICHLQTLLHEANFPLSMAMSALEKGNVEAARRSLENVQTILRSKVIMEPEKDGGWAKAPDAADEGCAVA